MNKRPCKDCVYCDTQMKFTPRGPQPDWYGWCSIKSIYPKNTPEGQVIPDGVKRADGDRCKPVIVDREKVMTSCVSFLAKK